MSYSARLRNAMAFSRHELGANNSYHLMEQGPMKKISFVLVLAVFATTVLAEQRVRPDGMGGWIVEDTGGCGGLFGAAQGACIAEQQRIQQQQLRQQQLIQQQQLENQRLQNELLRRQMEESKSRGQNP